MILKMTGVVEGQALKMINQLPELYDVSSVSETKPMCELVQMFHIEVVGGYNRALVDLFNDLNEAAIQLHNNFIRFKLEISLKLG